MSFLWDSYDSVRSYIYNYGNSYTGIYLSLILSIIIFIQSEKRKGVQTYLFFLSGVLLALLFAGTMCDTAAFFIFPSLLIIIISVLLIVVSLNVRLLNKKDSWIKIAVIVFALVLVEASVPLQLTTDCIRLPGSINKVSDDVVEISEIVQDNSVMLPLELRSSMKRYNWNLNVPLELTSDRIYEITDIFQVAQWNQVTYVVIERGNQLGDTDEAVIDSKANVYKYSKVDTIGEYLVYEYLE
ncbi:hypothetical protein SAMN02910453_0470 [Lachnospiraceae bacterium A10]|nr:hypothetical protein SAMN02910453_0470 [Lachnospiraceae bacterium A10]